MNVDPHANISDRMVEKSDVIIGYLTNPHVDMLERGEEAAFTVRRILAGLAKPKSTLIRLPLTPASVNLLTYEGPYADIISYGQRRQAEHSGGILNVSIFGGFVFSDTAKNGLAIIVTAREDKALAHKLAQELAEKSWNERSRYRKTLTPLATAVDLALMSHRAPVIFSDSGDNPGGGGTGRTTELLQALVNAKADNTLIGSFFDIPLAEAAHKAGVGAKIRAKFNTGLGLPCDWPFEATPKSSASMMVTSSAASGCSKEIAAARQVGGPKKYRRRHSDRHLAAKSDRRSDVLRNVRARYRQGIDRRGQVARAFPRRLPSVVLAGSRLRDRHRGVDLASSRTTAVDAATASRVSARRERDVVAAGMSPDDRPTLTQDLRLHGLSSAAGGTRARQLDGRDEPGADFSRRRAARRRRPVACTASWPRSAAPSA